HDRGAVAGGGGVALPRIGPGGQGELLEGQGRVVVAEQLGDERLRGVGPEAGIVAEDEVDGRGAAHAPSPPGGPVTASALASRIRSTRRTTRTVPATSWTRTIRHPWLTP